jgi:hexosaminidase
MDELEYMVFPRLMGHAEIGWSPASERNWDTYKLRLAKHGERLETLGLNFYRSALVPWDGAKKAAGTESQN